MGRVVKREFRSSGKKQILEWGPQGHLLSVVLKDKRNVVLSKWRAFYDGFGRRIQTTFTPCANGHPQERQKLTLTSFYDPEVEFLELGVAIRVGGGRPRTIWKVYGASGNGFYGENNGHGGLEAVIESDTKVVLGVINSLEGDMLAFIDSSNQIHWQKEIPGAYGPKGINFLAKMKRVFGAGELAKIVAEGVVWRNKAVDPTGFINFGARYYDPLTGRFLSCDPLGHLSTLDLYSYADGDPINNIDPDGRFVSEVYERVEPETLASMVADCLPYVGTGKAIEEFRTMRDPITGEPVSRWISGPGIFLGVLPGGKLVVKGVGKGVVKAGGFTKRMSKKLRKLGYQEHHIIPKMDKFSKHPLVEKAGFNVESRLNKMFLPKKGGIHLKRAIHRGAPSEKANRRLLDKMYESVSQGKSEGWTQQKYLKRIKEIRDIERSGLSSGKFELNQAK